MYYIVKYKPSDLMCDVICDDHSMLLVVNRFGIPLGFGNGTIEDVCSANNIDCEAFLAVINLLNNKYECKSDNSISPIPLMRYLSSSHRYFLDFRLPTIGKKLADAVGDADTATLIIKYFNDYVNEVRKHMEYEEQTVFPYITAIVEGGNSKPNYKIEEFDEVHHEIDSRLTELKDIIIKYCPLESSNELIGALYDIIDCAEDLLSHNKVEDYLLIPSIKRLEVCNV